MNVTKKQYELLTLSLQNEQSELVKARRQYKRKVRELETSIVANTVDMFGESPAKSERQLSAFDVPINLDAVPVALQPFADAIAYHERKIIEIQARLRVAVIVEKDLFGVAV